MNPITKLSEKIIDSLSQRVHDKLMLWSDETLEPFINEDGQSRAKLVAEELLESEAEDMSDPEYRELYRQVMRSQKVVNALEWIDELIGENCNKVEAWKDAAVDKMREVGHSWREFV